LSAGRLPAPAAFYCCGKSKEAGAMGSLIDELQRREAAARAEAEELRGRIAELTEQLAQAEERPSRLVITRQTVDEVLGEAGADARRRQNRGRRHRRTARRPPAEAARGSFEAAHAAVTGRCGPVIGKRRVEQAVVSAAADIAAFYAARVPVPATAPTLLVISADAKGDRDAARGTAPGHR
jgi:cell division septum initiation protein DivIVA